jgi:hypothetical protein
MCEENVKTPVAACPSPFQGALFEVRAWEPDLFRRASTPCTSLCTLERRWCRSALVMGARTIRNNRNYLQSASNVRYAGRISVARRQRKAKKHLQSEESEPRYPRRVSSSERYPYTEKLASWLVIEATKSRKQQCTLRLIHTDST